MGVVGNLPIMAIKTISTEKGLRILVDYYDEDSPDILVGPLTLQEAEEECLRLSFILCIPILSTARRPRSYLVCCRR